jgi:hypothetical protein
MIGGGGEQLTLRVVAKYADIWNHGGTDVEVFKHKVEVLHRHCEAIGRDPAEIELSVQARIDYEDIPGSLLVLQPMIEAGATHFILMCSYPYPEGIVATLAEEIIRQFG